MYYTDIKMPVLIYTHQINSFFRGYRLDIVKDGRVGSNISVSMKLKQQ